VFYDALLLGVCNSSQGIIKVEEWLLGIFKTGECVARPLKIGKTLHNE
jgi:hypothetical protein